MVEESKKTILEDVKESLDISSEDDAFDTELVIHIGAAIQTYEQACRYPFVCSYKKDTLWESIDIPDQNKDLLKQYVYLQTRITFDPPAPTTLGAFKDLAKDILLRGSVKVTEKGGD